MFKIRNIFILAAFLVTQQVFAFDFLNSDSKACANIAKACAAAGFTRGASPNKGFWKDCMKPIILGKTVSKVSISPDVAKTCRMDKIKQLKMELDQFQKAS